MDINNKVMALISASSLLIITAMVLYAFQLGFFGGSVAVTKERVDRTEFIVIRDANLAQVSDQETTNETVSE
jgi:hypothetical protein